MNDIFIMFGNVIMYILVFFLIHGGYNFWKDFRPEADSSLFGVPAEYIWDIVWFLIAALLLMNSGIIAPIICIIFMWKAIRRNQKRKTMEINNAMINERYEKINEMNREVQFLRHDWKNHILAIKTMMKEEKYAEAEEYLGELEENLKDEPMYIITGNSMMDAIIKQKTEIAREKGIDAQVFCDYMEGIKVADKDICVMVANLYDNAIEAAKCVKDSPWIRVNIARNEDMLMLKFSNNYVTKPNKAFDKYVSGKKDSDLHGYGLLSVEHAIKKYDGDLDTEYDEEKFVACITIYDGFGK